MDRLGLCGKLIIDRRCGVAQLQAVVPHLQPQSPARVEAGEIHLNFFFHKYSARTLLSRASDQIRDAKHHREAPARWGEAGTAGLPYATHLVHVCTIR